VAPASHSATARSCRALSLYWWNLPDHAIAKRARLPSSIRRKAEPFIFIFEIEHQTD
jgi:hypothetical protein